MNVQQYIQLEAVIHIATKMAKKKQKPAENKAGSRPEASVNSEESLRNQLGADISQAPSGFDNNLYQNLDEESRRRLWEKHYEHKNSVSESSISRRASFDDGISAEDGALLREIKTDNAELYNSINEMMSINPDKARELMGFYLIEKESKAKRDEGLAHGLGELLRDTTGMKVSDEEIKARISEASQKAYASSREEVVKVSDSNEQSAKGLTEILAKSAEIVPLPVEETGAGMPLEAPVDAVYTIPAGVPSEKILDQIAIASELIASEPFVAEPIAEKISIEAPKSNNGKKSKGKSGKSARLTIADVMGQVAELKSYAAGKDEEIYRDMATQLRLLETSLRQDLQVPIHDAAKNADEAMRQRDETGKILQDIEKKLEEIPVMPEHLDELEASMAELREQYIGDRANDLNNPEGYNMRIETVEDSVLFDEKKLKGMRFFGKTLAAATLAGSAIIAYFAGSCGRGCEKDEMAQIPQVQRAELEQIVKESEKIVKMYADGKQGEVTAKLEEYANIKINSLEEKIDERLRPAESKLEELSKRVEEIKISPPATGTAPEETEIKEPVVERIEPQETNGLVIEEIKIIPEEKGRYGFGIFAEVGATSYIPGTEKTHLDFGPQFSAGVGFTHLNSGFGARAGASIFSVKDKINDGIANLTAESSAVAPFIDLTYTPPSLSLGKNVKLSTEFYAGAELVAEDVKIKGNVGLTQINERHDEETFGIRGGARMSIDNWINDGGSLYFGAGYSGYIDNKDGGTKGRVGFLVGYGQKF